LKTFSISPTFFCTLPLRFSSCPSAFISSSLDRWTIAVRDNGIGFDRAHADEIFGVFKRLQGVSSDGTGMGLALVKRIVESHGGRIWAESEPGAGSTFYFALPISGD
jgi:signal transduction histidine kinase